MSKDTFPLKLPQSIKRAAERLAKEGDVSLNQWISERWRKRLARWKPRQNSCVAAPGMRRWRT